MLHSVCLKNFRCFKNTEPVELRKLNILLGANNAGKTSFLSAVELFLRSGRAGGRQGPLAFDELPSFASFDSVLRRHWSPSEQRPTRFDLHYSWKPSAPAQLPGVLSYEFACGGRSKDNTPYVAKVTYRIGKTKVVAQRQELSAGKIQYIVQIGRTKHVEKNMFFVGLAPVTFYRKDSKLPNFPSYIERLGNLEIVHPYRPVPRSFYVLDDPNLGREDRELLAYLILVWTSEDNTLQKVRERIVSNLKTLGLVTFFDVAKVSKRLGPKVFEIRVAPSIKRQRVTIADAGFGLSQALPLAVYDARLTDGYFIAYQPEVHLHPYAQSRLADIFTRSIARGNQLFVETHSPDLILRLQTKVANGELEARDVRVFCFENKQGRSQIRPVDFDTLGSPGIPWPPGFLDTSLGLARELATVRIKRTKNGR